MLINHDEAVDQDISYISEIGRDCEVIDQNTSIFSGLPDTLTQGNEKSELSDEKIVSEHKNVEVQCTKIIGKRLTKYIKNLDFLAKTYKRQTKRLEKHKIKTSKIPVLLLINKCGFLSKLLFTISHHLN